MRRMQIGVMGSSADLHYSPSLELLAEELGRQIAERGAALIFGAEKDYDSLSTAAGRGARSAGGLTVGVTYGDSLQTYDTADIIVNSGLGRGGGREYSLVLSCDAIIAISGGSGTLTEMAIAYQAGIPIIVIAGTGAWSDELAGRYLDARQRVPVVCCQDAAEAAEKAMELAHNRLLSQSASVSG